MQFASNFFTLMLISFVLNCELSVITIAANSSTPIMFISSQALFLNLFHLFYACGGAISKKVAGVLVSSNTNWQLMYLLAIIFSTVLLLLIHKTFVPKQQQTSKIEPVKISALLKNKIFVLYLIIVGCYLAAVGSTYSWFVNYIRFGYDVDVNTGSTYLSIFI